MMKGNFTREARLWMLDNILTRNVPYDLNKEAWINADLNSVSYFTENQVFDLGGRVIKVIETPGHTPGHVCLLYDGILFAGDLLENKNGTLRPYPAAWNWNNEKMLESVKKIAGMPVSRICPAHGMPIEGSFQF
jgi:glyoxylase-like metal-dependent hydrolase (beta-lactamase superfamily II)